MLRPTLYTPRLLASKRPYSNPCYIPASLAEEETNNAQRKVNHQRRQPHPPVPSNPPVVHAPCLCLVGRGALDKHLTYWLRTARSKGPVYWHLHSYTSSPPLNSLSPFSRAHIALHICSCSWIPEVGHPIDHLVSVSAGRATACLIHTGCSEPSQFRVLHSRTPVKAPFEIPTIQLRVVKHLGNRVCLLKDVRSKTTA